MASEYFRTKFHGELVRGGKPIACPHCRSTRGLTIEGYPGGYGVLSHCGQKFKFPAGWDARQALIDASFDIRRVRT